jgi:hypothetical protein
MSGLQIVKLLNPIQMYIDGTFTPKGAYDNAVTYVVGDMVDYQGSSYILYNASGYSAGTLPTNTTYWGVVAEKGATGATGATGAGVATGGTTGQVLAKQSATDFDTGWETLTKSSVGLGNVDNTSDANKPISTATQTALNTKANSGDLATVAITGDYDDLSNKPTIPPAAPVDSVNGQTGVVVLDTDDITDTATNRYTNDTDVTRLANTSGTNTGDQDLSGLTPTSRSISSGTGLTGGGDLTADRTLALDSATQTSLGLADTALQNLSGLDTDDLAEGTTNLYSQWTRGTDSSVNYIRPDTGTDQLLIGNTTDLSKYATFSDAKAFFISNASTGYFVNSAAGDTGFIQIGGSFLGTRARGSAASPSAIETGDTIMALFSLGYDGTDYAIETDGGFLFGAYTEATAVTSGRIDIAWRWKHLGLPPIFEITSGGAIGFHGVTPVARSTGWAVTNVTSDKVFDADSTSINELADVLGTLINDLIAKGLIGA